MPAAEFKELVREQFYILLIDQEAALAAIPSMLPSDAETREKALDLIRQIMNARGELSVEDKKRLAEMEQLFELGEGGVRKHLKTVSASPQAKAS
jgi:hypothetical protein